MKKKVLVVDDSKIVRHVLVKALKDDLGNYQIFEAEDGARGLEEATGQKIDIIFTDINMPRMGGIEMIDTLRMIDDYRDTPIIILTPEPLADRNDYGLEIKANGWLLKSFNSKQLSNLLQRIEGSLNAREP